MRLVRPLAACAAVLLLGPSCADPTAPPTAARRSPAARPRPDAAAAEPTPSSLVGQQSARCLDVQGASRDAGAPLILWDCWGGANQHWTLPPAGERGEVRVYGTLCLDVWGAQGNDGDRASIFPCHGGANQQWTLTAAGELRGLNDKCLDVWGAGTANGSEVRVYGCHGGANQRWDAAAAAPALFVGAGDVASCAWTGDEATAALLDTMPGVVWAAGDLAYQDGTADEFANCYGPSWGRHKARTRPAPGNHEYNTAGAAPYYAYFGDAAGPAGRGYYSYDVGAWHVVSLNSNVSVAAGSAQLAWLRADLAAHPAACTLAYWHHPRFTSSNAAGGDPKYQPLWQALYDANAEVVLVGHTHNYERFAPQTPAGAADPARGVRQFVVGTGGANLGGFVAVQPNSEFRDRAHHGVLRLELGASRYRWAFVSTDGAVRDAGEARCH